MGYRVNCFFQLSQLDEGLLLNGYLARNVAEELENATGSWMELRRPFYGQDVYVGYRLILALLRYEMSLEETSLIHIQDKHFVKVSGSLTTATIHIIMVTRGNSGHQTGGIISCIRYAEICGRCKVCIK